ncbi:unnamed protein product [Moneuplotes crassus]|uniref:Uncharacterized protein n=1 Tax=Euplotes crassus TaxID=5936 RepID=A0AAD1UCJ8_EUPCR|nr:unnamed protein product [Moneuplotes crassus]
MEILQQVPVHAQDIATEVLAVMQSKGVSQELITGLRQDSGFNRFCTECIQQRCNFENTTKQDYDRNLIMKLINKLKFMKIKLIESSSHICNALKVRYKEERRLELQRGHILMTECFNARTNFVNFVENCKGSKDVRNE